MKKLFIISASIFISGFVYSQDLNKQNEKTDDNGKRADYDRFIGKILNLNSNAPQTNFVFDLTKSPTLKLSLPVYCRTRHQLFVNGEITSTNNYTPIIKKGKWAPDASVNAAYTIFLKRSVKFYKSDVDNKYAGNIDNARISDASQLNWLWLNINAGYNYSSYIFYSDNALIPLDMRISEKKYNNFIFKTNLNWYFFPSRNRAKWFSITGNAGFSYKTNDNNYSSLSTVNVKTMKNFTDASGNIMEVIEDETTARKGNFILANSSTFDYNTMFLFSPTEKFYTGLSFYGKTRITNNLSSTDLGIGLTIPIQKVNGDEKTLASFTLKYDFPDVSDQISSLPLSEKGKLGFTIGIPITTFR